MALATYRLRVDWEGAGTWGGSSDVTARTLGVSWARGRDFASQLVGKSVAGKLAAELNNESGDYSPFNTASPLSGSLLPGRKVELSGTSGGTSYTLWTGYLERISVEPSLKDLNLARLEAIGPLGYLNQKEVQMPMVTSMLTGTAIGTLLDKAGWGTARSLDAGKTTLSRFWTERQQTIGALRKVEDTEAGFILETKAGTIAFEDRHHRLASPHLTSQATFGDTGTLVYSGIAQEDPLPQIFNRFRVPYRKFSVGTLQTLWTLSDIGTNSKIERDSGTKVYWARYPNPDSPTDALGVDAWTAPVATTDYTASSDPSGTGGTDLTAELSVAINALGESLKITLTNSGTADAYLGLLQARGTPVTQSDPVWSEAEDTPSQTAYGTRDFPQPPDFLPDTVEALDWCRYHLGIYKSPLPILAITIPVNRDSNHLTQALTRDISDRVTIIGTGSAGLGVNRDFFIEAEAHQVDARRTHTVTWLCSDAQNYSDFWVLDSSKLDTQTGLAY